MWQSRYDRRWLSLIKLKVRSKFEQDLANARCWCDCTKGSPLRLGNPSCCGSFLKWLSLFYPQHERRPKWLQKTVFLNGKASTIHHHWNYSQEPEKLLCNDFELRSFILVNSLQEIESMMGTCCLVKSMRTHLTQGRRSGHIRNLHGRKGYGNSIPEEQRQRRNEQRKLRCS